MRSKKTSPEPALARFDARRAALPERHRAACAEFFDALAEELGAGLLTPAQATIVAEHVVRLGERERNAANTGNVLDLWRSTLEETRDVLRAFAQMVTDSIKVVPMPATPLVPPIVDARPGSATAGQAYRDVSELPLAPPQRMLAGHTNVAWGDAEQTAAARELIALSHPGASAAERERLFWWLAMQSQHMPSSSFVLAAASGLRFEVRELFERAGCSAGEVEAAVGFFAVSARFDPRWLPLFMNPGPRDDPAYRAWLDEYHRHRAGLPEPLRYQLLSDTLTNFFPGTMHSGKWVDAAVQFSGVKQVKAVPAALAKIVNQYLAECVDLHRAPAAQFVGAVSATLKDYGVLYDKKSGLFGPASKAPAEQALLAAQFEAAWQRKIVGGVLRSSALFQRLGEELSARLLDCFERVVFEADERIIEEGAEGAGLFVIVDGKVAVTFPGLKGSGKAVELKVGDVFGEISLLSDDVTTARVTAAADTVALVLRPERFRDVVKRHSGMQDFLVKLAEERLAEMKRGKRAWRSIDPSAKVR